MRLLLCMLLLSIKMVEGFYLPGVAPTTYSRNDSVPLLVNHITPSLKTSSKKYVYSYDYYFPRFHFCKPDGGPHKQSESLGAIIFGDRIFNSPFEISMLENKTCETLCSPTYSKTDALFVNKNIRAGFKHNWLIDGLPVAQKMNDTKTNTEFYGSGFDLGSIDSDMRPNLYNHYELHIEYHQRGDNEFRIVGVTVLPFSLDYGDNTSTCNADLSNFSPVSLNIHHDTKVTFTYSVFFIPSETAWATRWDKYLHVYDPKIQWFALVNFSVIVLLLSIIMSHILVRSLRNDIRKYNEVDLDEDVMDETGWKLIHGDVFRAPKKKLILCVLVGSGVQMLLMAFTTTFFALLGLLSPSNRGSLSTVMIIFYATFGSVGSFVSANLYKTFQGEDWKKNMLLNPVLVPGAIFLVFIGLNFVLIAVHSSGAVPIGTLFAIVFIWFIFSVPLSVAGSFFGSKKTIFINPTKVNQIPRQIPPQPWYLRTYMLALLAGVFPFGAISIEMYFIYSSLWFNRIYYMFGFLFFCFILMLATTILVTVLLMYYTLCNENYHWQWKSFFVGAGISVYVFVHALLLSKFRLSGLASTLLYVGYSLLMSAAMGLICGSVAFLAVMLFIFKIYSQIKID
ncbi:Cellular adhesion and filamentous growth protein [Komagataella phaffii]|uniref:Transmembrane 9 superfamily member n=1 Tax=Komagataella phaffii (strain GS115 / ATCC 20864) TaxID=644223 RepID=C4R1Q4_KOMPG|nr:Protein with a role in cellular adhesion and filamentous growth [Komagataella phaffii GS115]AOA63054.1 GQ67_00844T0 [Komagataella phaffii]AOA68173.1 GQ68_00545T0 [Komagataella phaffii GS115]CAY69428.1 Protein with a role in cellular adhesion and filamentous growth [Komagataella phaffii GS115]